MQNKRLTELKLGEKGVIYKIEASGKTRIRLQELGFINRTVVECYLISPLGEPIAYKIKNTIIALRYEDAITIIIEPIDITSEE